MELGKQIRRYRTEKSLSQEALAEKVYVSRQTISNWENDRSYPDINSIVLLSETFDVSIDKLIKGDVEKMKERINEQVNREDQREFNLLSTIFSVLFLAVLITPVPLAKFLSYAGIAIWLVLVGAGAYFGRLVEKKKKEFNVQTYKEIVAFTEGRSLSDIEKAREEGKRPYQKALMVIFWGAAALIFSLLMGKLFGL